MFLVFSRYDISSKITRTDGENSCKKSTTPLFLYVLDTSALANTRTDVVKTQAYSSFGLSGFEIVIF